MTDQNNKFIDDLPMPFKEFEKRFGWPNKSTLQRMRYKAKEMGLEKAFVKFSGFVLVKPKTFFELIEKQQDEL